MALIVSTQLGSCLSSYRHRGEMHPALGASWNQNDRSILAADLSELYRSSAFLLLPTCASGACIALLKLIDCRRTRSAALAQVIGIES